MKLTQTIEDYLGMMFILERDGEVIQGVRLAELLGVSPPTVTNTLKRMVRDGLVSMDGPKGTHLTEKGMEAACTVMRRHMLTEWMVSRLIPWSRLHEEAHDLEHAISEEMEVALLKELNLPELCPHGNPFPGYENAVISWLPLTHFQAGDSVIIRRIHELAEEIPGLLEFLEQNKLLLGQQVLLVRRLDFNQTFDLDVEGQIVSLGFATARYIFVESVQ